MRRMLGLSCRSILGKLELAQWNHLDLDMNNNVKALSTILFFLLTFHLDIVGIARAEAPKNSVAGRGFVTSWDGAKIHYLEAGNISTMANHSFLK
jgi:hypothetical protein